MALVIWFYLFNHKISPCNWNVIFLYICLRRCRLLYLCLRWCSSQLIDGMRYAFRCAMHQPTCHWLDYFYMDRRIIVWWVLIKFYYKQYCSYSNDNNIDSSIAEFLSKMSFLFLCLLAITKLDNKLCTSVFFFFLTILNTKTKPSVERDIYGSLKEL